MKLKPFIVAELSANHNGSFDRACQIVKAAAEAGADAIKLQTYIPEEMVGDRRYRVESGPWKGQRLIDLYRQAHTPWEWHPELFAYAKDLGLQAFSTPFCRKSVEFLESIGCPMYKVASFEITDLQLLDAIAKTNRPVIISTGMASWHEIVEAVKRFRLRQNVTLLKCTSSYPALLENANLSALTKLKSLAKVGLSDHTMGTTAATVATVLGASVIEKHLTLSREDGGPDAAFSAEPHEFAEMVENVTETAKALGQPIFGPTAGEMPELRRSIYYTKSLPENHKLSAADLKIARPAKGAPPATLSAMLNKPLIHPVKAGQPAQWEDINATVSV